MRICPVSFVSLDVWDFSYIASSNCFVDDIAVTYAFVIDSAVKSQVDIETSPQDDTMTDWDVFFEYVTPAVQGCPLAMVKQAVISSAIEFCEKSLIWKQDSIQNDVLAGKAHYTYAPPLFAKVVMPYKVTINDVELEPWDVPSLEYFDKDWKLIESEYPTRYVQVMDDTIRLIGVPTKDIFVSDTGFDGDGNPTPSGLMADVVLCPTRNARKCPTFLYTDWVETIASGALARLHAQVGKVWAKPELVSRYEKLFREGVSYAKSKSDKSYQRSSNNMRPIQYYGGRAYYN